MHSKNKSSGFALGMVLLVVVLMATVTVAMSYGFRSGSNDSAFEKANAYASAIKSQGMTIRNVIRSQMSAETYALANRDPSCNRATNNNCIINAVQLRKIPDEAFTENIAAASVYDLWRYNTAFNFTFSGSLTLMDVYVFQRPILPAICTLIESRNRSTRVAIDDVPVVASLKFNATHNPGVEGTANWMPVAVDGCLTDGTDHDRHHYYVVIGRTSS